MILQLSQSQTVNHVHLNFGERPPRSYSLSAGDNPEDLQTLLKETQIDISAPYGSFDAAEVAVRLGNTTDASFQETTARYFQLSITGCQEVTDGVGATVAEWSLSKRG